MKKVQIYWFQNVHPPHVIGVQSISKRDGQPAPPTDGNVHHMNTGMIISTYNMYTFEVSFNNTRGRGDNSVSYVWL